MSFEVRRDMWAIRDAATGFVSDPLPTEGEADLCLAKVSGGKLRVVPVTVTIAPREMPTDSTAFAQQLPLIPNERNSS